MFSLIKYILGFIVLNVVLNSIFRINPILDYVIYFGLIAYWFSSFRFKTRSFRTNTNYTNPKPQNRDNVIDVEFTERDEN
jgi:hypothetical protein